MFKDVYSIIGADKDIYYIGWYKGNKSEEFNKCLRGDKEIQYDKDYAWYKNAAETLQSFLLTQSINYNICVYRFVSYEEYRLLTECKGDIITYPNFLSTTALPNYYRGEEKTFKNKRLIKILINKNTPGMALAEVVESTAEYEILLPAKTKLLYVGTEKNSLYIPESVIYSNLGKVFRFENINVFKVIIE